MTHTGMRRFVVVGADRQWRRWVGWHLDRAGAVVVAETPAGTNRSLAMSEALGQGADVLLLVNHGDDDPLAGAAWSAAQVVIPVLIDEPTPLPGLLRNVTPVELYDVPRARLGDHLLAELDLLEIADEEPRLPGDDPIHNRAHQLLNYPPSDVPTGSDLIIEASLPRLRRLHGIAMTEAGRIPTDGSIRDDWTSFEDGLYVRRTIESRLRHLLTDAPPAATAVVGEPGAGKTSLLWGVATALAGRKGHETFLVKARWLSPNSTGKPFVDGSVLVKAIQSAIGQGRGCSVLVDTVDVLVGDEHARLRLQALVETAVAQGASVLISCRRREAALLPRSWPQIPLNGYSSTTEDHGDDQESEFDRAVTAHARFYCRAPARAADMTAQLLRAVTRRQPLGRMAQHPLTLRMLFEIYRPGIIPENVDLTDLYAQFWDNRIFRDRGNWGAPTDREGVDRDLTDAAFTLALAMLRTGSIEVRPDDAAGQRSEDRVSLNEAVEVLCRRGVGTRVAGGGFRFFHQTFFEFAAGKALMDLHPLTALQALRRRVYERPADYFLIAVLEQTWLWAARHPAYRAQAEVEARAVLGVMHTTRSTEDSDGTGPPYAFIGAALAVIVQSPTLPPDLQALLADTLRTTALPILRDVLALLPPPSREPGPLDIAITEACLRRDDAAWASTLPMLLRIADRDPDTAGKIVEKLPLVDRINQISPGNDSDHRDLWKLLIRFFPSGPRAASDGLRKLCRAAVKAGQTRYLISLFDTLIPSDRVQAKAAVRLADDMIVDDMDRNDIARSHAELHMRAIMVDGPNVDWTSTLDSLRDIVARFESPGRITRADSARLGGLILAHARHGPRTLGVEVLEILGISGQPRLHAELHRGLFCELLQGHGSALDSWVIDHLRAGLPLPRGPRTREQHWANTIRMALAQPTLPAAQVGRICRAAMRDPESPSPWQDVQWLLPLVVKCAVSEVPGAVAVVTDLDQVRDARTETYRAMTKQLITTLGSMDEAQVVINILLSAGDLNTISTLIEKGDPAAIAGPVKAAGSQIGELAVSSLGASTDKERKRAGRLLVQLVLKRILPPPSWTELLAWGRTGEAASEAVARIAGHGLSVGAYDYADVRDYLLSAVEWRGQDPIIRSDRSAARREFVVACAADGTEEDMGLICAMAFATPIEGHVVAEIAPAVQPTLRRGAPLSTAVSRALLIEVGTRLRDNSVSAQARKIAANRWREGMKVVADDSFESEQTEVVRLLPRLEGSFAAALCQMLHPARFPSVHRAMQLLMERSELDGQVRRNIRISLENSAAQHGDSRWESLHSDLRGP